MNVSILVVSFNTKHLLGRFFQSVEKLIASSPELSFEVIVVENASTDGSLQALRSDFSQYELIVNESNVGFGRANNQALAVSTGDFVLLLNTDAFIESGSFSTVFEWMSSHQKCAVLGAKLVNADGSLQPSCRYFPNPINVIALRTGLSHLLPSKYSGDDLGWSHDQVRECDWVPGCFYLVRRASILDARIFDPLFFLYYEEVDHCKGLKIRGWQVVFHPGIVVHHIGGESAKTEGSISKVGKQLSLLQIESELIFFRKYYGLLGIAFFIVANLFATTYLVLKSYVKNRSALERAACWKDFQHLLEILRSTKIATVATR
jgi:N-acetylglucosaminyl-diphospho-decaprenol L-rhamnosyltransferase